MIINQLRTYESPDLADHVIHFAGRVGPRFDVPESITDMPDQQRLAEMLINGRILGHTTFGSESPVVCLTESTKPAATALIREGRYAACGVGFTKDFVFRAGGGPAFYVRGDEWTDIQRLPQPLRSRAVRFWPGAQPTDGRPLPPELATQSEWLIEREWRVPGNLEFTWDDVAFLVTPDPRWKAFYADFVGDLGDDMHERWFLSIPSVSMDSDGVVTSDELGIWS